MPVRKVSNTPLTAILPVVQKWHVEAGIIRSPCISVLDLGYFYAIANVAGSFWQKLKNIFGILKQKSYLSYWDLGGLQSNFILHDLKQAIYYGYFTIWLNIS